MQPVPNMVKILLHCGTICLPIWIDMLLVAVWTANLSVDMASSQLLSHAFSEFHVSHWKSK